MTPFPLAVWMGHRVSLLFAIAALGQAQMGGGKADGIEYLVTFLGMPCDPAAENHGYPCPPEIFQGVLLQARSENGTARIKISIDYEREGEERGASVTFDVPPGDVWTSKTFRIGRIKTAALPGVRIRAIRMEKDGKVLTLWEEGKE